MRKPFPPHSTSIVVSATVVFWLAAAHVAGASDEVLRFEPQRPVVESGRATGLVHVDLPLSIRARFDSNYTDDLYLSDALARPYAFTEGPWLRVDPSLENRFALTKAISEKVEIGLVWRGRSPISTFDFFDFERHTVSAMIRIVP